jgi:hypothetical protein
LHTLTQFICFKHNKDDAPKSKVRSQAQMRQDKRKQKKIERSNDTQSHRGFSTDQRISIESMNINKKRLIHQQNETRLVGLSIQEAAIRSQIESAESRANSRCPKYNKNNVYWKRVDELLEEQDQVIKTIKEHSQALIDTDVTQSNQLFVSDFINQDSPAKKHNYHQMIGNNESPFIFDLIDNEDGGLEVKKELMNEATKKGGVSKQG